MIMSLSELLVIHFHLIDQLIVSALVQQLRSEENSLVLHFLQIITSTITMFCRNNIDFIFFIFQLYKVEN